MTKRNGAPGDGPRTLTAEIPAGVVNGILRACRTRPRPGLRFDHELTVGATEAGIDISTRGLIHGGVRTSIRVARSDEDVDSSDWRGIRVEAPVLEAATAGNRIGKWTLTADRDIGTLDVEGTDGNGRIRTTIRNDWRSARGDDTSRADDDLDEPIHTVTLASFHTMAARLGALEQLRTGPTEDRGGVEVRGTEEGSAVWTLHIRGLRIDVETPALATVNGRQKNDGATIEMPLQALIEFDAACGTDDGECEVRRSSLTRTWGSRLKTVTRTRWSATGRYTSNRERMPEPPKTPTTRIGRFHGDAARCVIDTVAEINAAVSNSTGVVRIRNTPGHLGLEGELTLNNGYPTAIVQRTSNPTNGREYEPGAWTAWVRVDAWCRAIDALRTHGAARHTCNDFDVFESVDDQVMFLKNAGMWDGDPGRGGVTVAMATERN